MRKKSKEVDSITAFNRHQTIIGREIARRRLFAENVLDLSEMFENQEYKVILGFDPPPQWSGYLSQVEVYYSRGQVERWRKIVKKLIKDFGFIIDEIVDIPEGRLEDITKISETKDEANELIVIAKTALPRDWKITINKRIGKPNPDDCEHKPEHFAICKRCGNKEKIQNI